MLDQIKYAPWGDWIIVMSRGNPPLALQFLFINLVFFLIFAVRRLRGHKTNQNNFSFVAHGLMFMANVAILYQADLLPMYHTRIMMFWNHFQQVI